MVGGLKGVLVILGISAVFAAISIILIPENRSLVVRNLITIGKIKNDGLVVKAFCKLGLHVWNDVKADAASHYHMIIGGLRYGERTCISCKQSQVVSGLADDPGAMSRFWYKVKKEHLHLRKLS